jgi:hypothetical protein
MKLSRIIPISALLLLAAACATPGQNFQIAQERHSCAELGIDPGSPDFASCVSNLDASIAEANNHVYQ